MSDKTKFRSIGVEADIDALATKEASDIAGQQSLLKDTVGWTGKNLLKNTAKSGSNQGITYTVNSDKSITINGTNTDSAQHSVMVGIVTLDAGDYKANGLKNDGGYTSFWINLYSLTDGSNIKDIKNANEDVTFTLSVPKQVRVNVYWAGSATVSNITVYPMLRRADITDPTYEPYHESVETMYEEEIHGVNLLEVTASTQTINGVTFTVNADGTIKANGTATADVYLNISKSKQWEAGTYILSGGVSDNVRLYFKDSPQTKVLAWDKGDSPEFTVSDSLVYNCAIYIKNGYTANNVILKPMLRKADIDDSTYRPYNHQAIQNQLNAQGVLGAKNLLEVTANTETRKGTTFTINKDDKGNVLNVNVNGTPSSDIYFRINSKFREVGRYILNGILGGSNTFRMQAYIYASSDDTFKRSYTDTGSGTEVVIDDGEYANFEIIVTRSGGAVSNKKVYPMLRLASDPDDTYQPYAMTNRELTEDRYYHAGDTVNVSLMNFAGLITNNSKEIRFTIPLMKDLSKITGITFKNTTTVSIRKPGGGYIVDGTISSGYSITILAKAGNLLSIKLTKTDDSAFDATNNMPLDVAFTGGSNDSVITFS